MASKRRLRLTVVDPDGDELVGVTTVEIPQGSSGPRNFEVVFQTDAVASGGETCLSVRLRSPSGSTVVADQPNDQNE